MWLHHCFKSKTKVGDRILEKRLSKGWGVDDAANT